MLWTTNTRSSEPARRPFLRGLAAGGLLGTFLGGAASALATDDAFSFWHTGRGCSGRHWSHDPLAAKERADFMSDWVLDRLEASDDQRAQIKGLLAQMLDELAPLREEHRAHRAQFVAALTQAEVDRGELERLRRAELELGERASTTVVASLASMAQALTAEQRARLAELAARWRERHRGA